MAIHVGHILFHPSRRFYASLVHFSTCVATCSTFTFGKIVINELHYNPPGAGDATEFIEFYNTSASAIDLSSWRMSDGVTYTFPAGATIPAYGFLVLAKNTNAFTATYPWVINVYGPYDPTSLANEGERVALSDAAGNVVCEVTYDDAPPWPTEPDGDGPSLELRNPALEPNDPANWAASRIYGGTPGMTNSVYVDEAFAFNVVREPLSPPSVSNVLLRAVITRSAASNITVSYTTPAGWTNATFMYVGGEEWQCTLPPQPDGTWVYYVVRAVTSNNLVFWHPPRATNLYRVMDHPFRPRDVIINEIMYNSAVEAHVTSYEYVELLNASGRTVDLAGCVFEECRVPTNEVRLAPGELAVIADKPTVLTSVYGALPRVLPLNIGLSDNGETLRLWCPNGVPLCAVTYDGTAPWPTAARGFGPSLELRHPAAPLDDPRSWGASQGYGTPGRPNSMSTNQSVISLFSIQCRPHPPRPYEPFWILAHVPAATSLWRVTLYYRTNNVSLFSLPMYDDGLHEDGDAGDSVYGVMMPAMPANRTVWFYLRVQLLDGTEVIFPPPTSDRISAPPLTVRLSYGGLSTTVTPTTHWQRATTSGQATSSRLYVYSESAGEVLVDDVSITYAGEEHVTNGTFTSDLGGWTLVGNHSSSYHDISEGYAAPGCLHIVATGVGGGATQNHVRQDINPPLLQDGRVYTLSFAYRAAPPQPPRTNWFWVHIGTNGPRTVCINELNYHPMHDGLGDLEFIELYNYGAQPVDITQWSLENSDGTRFAITEEVVLLPGGCAVLCRDLGAFTNVYAVSIPVLGDVPFNLGNRRDMVILRAWDGQVVDVVSYEDSAPWPTRADGAGATLERMSPRGSGTSATNWMASPGGGSPGAPNDPSAPAILAVWHEPAVPTPFEPVTIFARTTNVVTAPRLFYQPNETGTWLTVPMSSPGAAGISSVTLGMFPHRTYVPFYVEVSQATVIVRFPTGGARQPALFESDAMRDAYTLPVFRYLFTTHHWNVLNTRWLWDNTDVDATLIIGTQIFYNVGIHYHGNYSRQWRQAYNAYLNYGQTYRGRRKVAYVHNWENASRLGVPVGQALYRRINYPIFDTFPITVKVRGEQLNLMHYVEPYDTTFLLSNTLPIGNLYKATQADLQQALFTFSGYDPAVYEYCYELHGSTESGAQFTDLARALEALYVLPPDVFAQQATQWFNATSFAIERAMYHYLFNSDGWPQWGQNYVLFATRDHGVQILPQDIGAIGVWYGWRLFPTVAGVQRLIRIPEVMRPFWHFYTNLYYGPGALSVQHSLVEQFYHQCSNDVNLYYGNASTFRNDATSFKNSLQAWNTRVSSYGEADIGPVGIVNWQLVWLSQPNRCVLVNQPYWYRACAMDTGGRPVTYAKHIGAAWLHLDPTNGVLSGTPPGVGIFPVLITAHNGVIAITQSFNIVVQQPSPRLLLKFDEDSGSVVSDRTVWANHGVRQGNTSWSAEGRYGGCLFIGATASDRVYVPGTASLTPAGDFTLEAWVRFTQFNKPKAQVFKKFEEFGFEMGQDSTIMGGRFWYGPFDNGASRADGLNGHGYAVMRYHPDPTARMLAPNVWHHVAVTHERDRNEVYIYVNGQRIGGLVWEDSLLGTANDPLIVGGPFNGWIDEVKLLSVARKAFNPGVSIEAVRYASPRQYIQFRYFNRGDVPPINLRKFAVRIEPTGVWAPLPDIAVPPGGDVRVELAQLPGIGALPASGGLALYPFEPDTLWPSGNYEHVCTKILDYVAWGGPEAAPSPDHPAVQAGLWQAYGVVATSADSSGRITLITPGRNDNGVFSWHGGMIVPEASTGVWVIVCVWTAGIRRAKRRVPASPHDPAERQHAPDTTPICG